MDRFVKRKRADSVNSIYSVQCDWVDTDAAPPSDEPQPQKARQLRASSIIPVTERVQFDINWKQLPTGTHYRPLHSRTITTSARTSFIWQHGADLLQDKKKKWLCKHCHKAKAWHRQLMSANGTQHIHEHLWKYHKIRGFGEQEQQEQQEQQDVNSRPGVYSLMAPFNEAAWKQDYINWIVCDDITFEQSVSSRLHKLFVTSGPMAQRIYPHSGNTARDWVMDQYQTEQIKIKDLSANSSSKINISFDLWSSTNGHSLCGVVGHFIGISYRRRLC